MMVRTTVISDSIGFKGYRKIHHPPVQQFIDFLKQYSVQHAENMKVMILSSTLGSTDNRLHRGSHSLPGAQFFTLGY
jgi:hypothetical protein